MTEPLTLELDTEARRVLADAVRERATRFDVEADRLDDAGGLTELVDAARNIAANLRTLADRLAPVED